jgi:hypothetical protein
MFLIYGNICLIKDTNLLLTNFLRNIKFENLFCPSNFVKVNLKIMKNNQKLIEEKKQLYAVKKQSLILSSLLEAQFITKLGSKKTLEDWRDTMLDDMNRLKKEIKDLDNN